LALTPANRRRAKADKQLLASVRDGVQTATGVEEVELFELERIGIQQIVSVFGTFVLVGFLLSLVANRSEISDAISEAEWDQLPILLVLSMATYVTGAVSLMGAIVRRLPLLRTTLVMFAQSFLNRFTPMNAGGMAMRVRYLQKGGTDVTVAAASVGLTSAASGVAQGLMILLFALWAGTSPGGSFSFPSIDDVALVVFGVAALIAVVVLVPSVRGFALRWLDPLKAKIGGEARELFRRPEKLAQLFGGAALGKLFTIGAFVVSCRAFGIELGFAELGALYLFGNTVGSAVPTPGGVGGVEAALIAVLTGAGVGDAEAAAAVLIFRLATYWLPVIPGYLCLRQARSLDLV
jgi:undecaprenyl-diphosphatase